MAIVKTLAQLRSSVQTRWQLDNSPDMGDDTNSLGVVALNEMINDALVETHDILVKKWADYKTVGPVQFSTVAGQDAYAYDDIVATGPVGLLGFYKLRKLEISRGSRWFRLYPADLEGSHHFVSNGVYSNRYRYRTQLSTDGLSALSLVLMPTPTSIDSLRLWYVQNAPQLGADSATVTFQVPIEQKLVLAIVGRDVLDRQELDPSPAIARVTALTKQLDVAADGLDVSMPFMINEDGPDVDDDWDWWC